MKNKILYGLLGVGAIAVYLLFKKYNKKVSVAEAKEVLNDWKKNFDSKNLEGIVNNYSQDGVLVSTFGDILTGREAIKEYFVGLFKKDQLSVDYLDEPQVMELDGATTLTGLYQFNYSENGKMNNVKSRYSFICKKINGTIYIIKQHSSVAN
jgi:uncharacterized protein (TIGR02246 family)